MSDLDSTTQGFTIPFFQAIITGSLTGLAVGAGAALTGLASPLPAGVGAAAGVSLLSWISYRSEVSRRLDALAGLQQSAQQARNEQTIRVEVIQDNGLRGDYLTFPGGRERLAQLAGALATGAPLTARRWTGRGGLYSPGEFERLRSELIERGLACWRSDFDHRGGAELTRPGLAAMRYIARASSPSPSPRLERRS